MLLFSTFLFDAVIVIIIVIVIVSVVNADSSLDISGVTFLVLILMLMS